MLSSFMVKYYLNMKYLNLWENFNTNKVYHVAPVSKRELIQKNGLLADSPKRYNNISEDNVYAWEYLKMAMWYASTEARDNGIDFDIWEINYSGESVEDKTIGLPYAIKINSVEPENVILVDTISTEDERIQEYSDIEEIISEIEWS